jgi:hypothetical protein
LIPSTSIDSINPQLLIPSTSIDCINPQLLIPSTSIDCINPQLLIQSTSIDSINPQLLIPLTSIDSINPQLLVPSTSIGSINPQQLIPSTSIDSINPIRISDGTVFYPVEFGDPMVLLSSKVPEFRSYGGFYILGKTPYRGNRGLKHCGKSPQRRKTPHHGKWKFLRSEFGKDSPSWKFIINEVIGGSAGTDAILEGFCGAIVGDMGMCLFTGDGRNTAWDMSMCLFTGDGRNSAINPGNCLSG